MSLSSTEMNELYRELLVDHAKQPRNFREMADANHRAEGHNRACGDKITVWARVSDGMLADVSFKGSGCAISTSSASMMTQAMKGQSLDDARSLFEKFHAVLTSGLKVESDDDGLGKLAAFSGVRKFPVRVKCATLPWHTLRAALNDVAVDASTEGTV